MINSLKNKNKGSRRLYWLVAFFVFAFCAAHPLPDTKLFFHFSSGHAFGEIKAPLRDFEIVAGNPEKMSLTGIEAYFTKHVIIKSADGKAWKLSLVSYSISTQQYDGLKLYKEISFMLLLAAPDVQDTRDFTLYFDAFVHQIYNHKTIVAIDTDWENGLYNKNMVVGIIGRDTETGALAPLHISLEKGSTYTGFKTMVLLGCKHIAQGTDHILFLLSLLIVAPFTIYGKKWSVFISRRYAFKRILKITLAFTLGHSLTLAAGALGWVTLPAALVEVFIALTIILAGINVIRPIFHGKEMYITFLFGLIHGLAFANTIIDLSLDTATLVLSILGFNLGIELVQLGIIIIFLPVLLFLTRFQSFAKLRPVLGMIVIVLAAYWLYERLVVLL